MPDPRTESAAVCIKAARGEIGSLYAGTEGERSDLRFTEAHIAESIERRIKVNAG